MCLRARAWWVIRRKRQVTLADLLLTVSNGDEKRAYGNLNQFLRGLAEAGVLRRQGRRHVRWRLARDLGTRMPVVRDDHVFDPNSLSVLVRAGRPRSRDAR